MAITLPTTARELARTFAQAAQNDPLAQEIWVNTRRDGAHIWLLIQPADDKDERRLCGLLDVLDERFPNADFQLHILNPASYTIDLRDVLPRDAEKIFTRAG